MTNANYGRRTAMTKFGRSGCSACTLKKRIATGGPFRCIPVSVDTTNIFQHADAIAGVDIGTQFFHPKFVLAHQNAEGLTYTRTIPELRD